MLKRWKMVMVLLMGCLLPGWAAENEVQRVLMIGNSYTYCNRLPEVLMALSQRTDCPLVVDSYTVGAMSLRGFLDSPEHDKARRMLAEGNYDWVVLQDQSQTPAYMPEETLHAVRGWVQLARQQDTQALLFLTWAHAARTAGGMQPMVDMQEKLSNTYCRAALECGVRVAPVGEAWARWYRRRPDKPLHVGDGSHPNAKGTYLAACVLHGAISGAAPRQLCGTLRLGGQVVLRMPPDSASALQKTAQATLKHFGSPQKWLERQVEEDGKRPSVDDVKKILVRGVRVEALEALAGKAFCMTRQQNQVLYQFRLRGGAELGAYCTPQGKVQQVSIAVPGRMVDIIDLNGR